MDLDFPISVIVLFFNILKRTSFENFQFLEKVSG